jgi:hypothetical protein
VIPELLRHPEPALLADSATPDDILQALRQCSAEDGWPDESLDLVDFLLTSWTADFSARPDDRESIAELQRLIAYARTRAGNHPSLPPATSARWSALTDVLEARRRTINGRDPSLFIPKPSDVSEPSLVHGRSHVSEILGAIGQNCASQQALLDALGSDSKSRKITAGRLSQLLSLMEAHGLITRKRKGRENQLALTPLGATHAPKPTNRGSDFFKKTA